MRKLSYLSREKLIFCRWYVITILITVYGCIWYYPEEITKEVVTGEKSLEWKIDKGYQFDYPVWEEAYFFQTQEDYNLNLYKNNGREWVKWMNVEKKVTHNPRINVTIPEFPQIYWERGEYIYISARFPVMLVSNSEQRQVIKLYKIVTNRKAIEDEVKINCIGGWGFYRGEPYIDKSNIFEYKGRNLIIFADKDEFNPAVKILSIDESNLGDIKCYLVAESKGDFKTPITHELEGRIIKLQWVSHDDLGFIKRHEIQEDLENLKEEKCWVE